MAGALLILEELEPFLEEKADEIYTYLKILSRDSELAEDLAQTVMVKFIEEVGKNRIIKETAAGYLIRMAKNEYFQHLRKKGNVPLEENELAADRRKEIVETNSREIHILVMDTLSDPGHPAEVTEVARLRFIDELGLDQICNKTGKSRTTVHRLLQKGLTILHDAFQRQGFNVQDLEF